MVAQRHRREAQRRRPALGAPPQRREVVGRQRDAQRAEQRAGLVQRERRSAARISVRAAVQAQAAEPQRRVRARGDHQPQRRRRVAQRAARGPRGPRRSTSWKSSSTSTIGGAVGRAAPRARRGNESPRARRRTASASGRPAAAARDAAPRAPRARTAGARRLGASSDSHATGPGAPCRDSSPLEQRGLARAGRRGQQRQRALDAAIEVSNSRSRRTNPSCTGGRANLVASSAPASVRVVMGPPLRVSPAACSQDEHSVASPAAGDAAARAVHPIRVRTCRSRAVSVAPRCSRTPQRVEIAVRCARSSPSRSSAGSWCSRCSRSARCSRSSSPPCSRSGSTRSSARSCGAAGGAAARRSSCSPRCSPSVFVLVLVTAGPAVGPDRRVRPRAARRTGTSSRSSDGVPEHHLDGGRRRDDPQRRSRTSPRGCRTPRPRCSASPAACSARCCRSSRSRSSSLFLLMERPTITDWLFGFTPPEVERALAAGGRGLDPRGLLLADRQRRDLGRRRRPSPASRRGRFGLPFPIVLAVITGLLDLIPQVGATIAAVILVAVALTVSTPRRRSRCWSSS